MGKLTELRARRAKYEAALDSAKMMEPGEYKVDYGDGRGYVSFNGSNTVKICSGCSHGYTYVPIDAIGSLIKVLAGLIDDGAESAEGGD